MFDGDTIFTLATGEIKADVNLIAAYAPDVVAAAIISGVKAAGPVNDLPAYSSRLHEEILEKRNYLFVRLHRDISNMRAI